jgi:hypothetical protein
VKRWLLLALALALLAFALVRVSGRGSERAGAPPMDRIDDASRQKLRDVLREGREP